MAFTINKVLLCVLLLCTVEETAAQGGGNHWVFGTGGYGLDFSKDPPEFYKTANLRYSTVAACSDENGNLLFYSNGDSIWNKKHLYMKGSLKIKSVGVDLDDHVQIIPVPGKKGKYYLFTASMLQYEVTIMGIKSNRPLEYVTIDMNKDNGNGEVIDTLRNKLTSVGTFNLVGIPHSNKTDYWLLSRSTDTMLVFLINTQGIQLMRKIYLDEPTKRSTFNTKWSNKFSVSNNGRHLIWVQMYGDSSLLPNGSYSNALVCSSIKHLSFNPETGEVGSPKIIDSFPSFIFPSEGNIKTYRFNSAGFSPNDSVLYSLSDLSWGSPNQIYKTILKQYIKVSEDSFSLVFADTIQGPAFPSAIRLAPNGKMMIAGRYSSNPIISSMAKIAIVDQPDVPGRGCKIIKNSFAFPYFLNKYTPNGVDTTYTNFYDFAAYTGNRLRIKYLYRPNERCDGFTRFYNFSDSVRFARFTWYINGDSIEAYEVQYAFAQPGNYYVRLKGTTPAGLTVWFTDTVVIEGHHFKPKAGFSTQTQAGCRWVGFQFNDTSVCNYSKNGWRQWLFGDGNTYTYGDTVLFHQIKHTYTTDGNFTVKLMVHNGHCTDTFTTVQQVVILDAPKPGFTISPQPACVPVELTAHPQVTGAVDSIWYSWGTPIQWELSNIQQTASKKMLTSGASTIYQKLRGPTGCITSDSLIVILRDGFPSTYAPQWVKGTYLPEGNVQVQWNQQPNEKGYTLAHSTDGTNWKNLLSTTDTLYRHTPLPADAEHHYRLTPFDACDQPSVKQVFLKTIRIQAQVSPNENSATVRYSTYEQTGATAIHYQVERRYDTAQTYIPISGSAVFAGTYHDEGYFRESGFQSCYRIKALLSNAAEVYSNDVCLTYEPVLWIPDAFSPNQDGLNDTYSLIHAGVTDFTFTVYNRWGQRVFDTVDPSFTWDGSQAPAGVYAYTLSYKTSQGRKNLTGTIQLVR